jgi:two-component system chemotaxis response regulator CheY
MKALVVDDSMAARYKVGKVIKGVGFEVVEAASGREALERLAEHGDVGIAFVDWNMPFMNGLELVVELRKDGRFETLPIMMVTTETEMHQMVRALEAGANEYMMKPFSAEMLLDKLAILGIDTPSRQEGGSGV